VGVKIIFYPPILTFPHKGERKQNKIIMKKIISFLFFSLLLTGLAHAQIPETEPISIKQVMDGDTFRLSNGQKLKLAGVNAPELHDTPKLPQEARRFKKEIWAFRALGDEAERISQRFVKAANNKIFLETTTQSLDEQGNLLAYVHMPVSKLDPGMTADGQVIMQEPDGSFRIFLNAYLLTLGLAELDRSSLDSSYQSLFERLLAEAKKNKKGLWS